MVCRYPFTQPFAHYQAAVFPATHDNPTIAITNSTIQPLTAQLLDYSEVDMMFTIGILIEETAKFSVIGTDHVNILERFQTAFVLGRCT
jgi:hypothetical protein